MLYYDPIGDEEVEIKEDTTLYLVKTGDRFAIRGVSSGLNLLASDPTTHANEYWLLNTRDLLSRCSKDQELYVKLFPGDRLSSELFPLEKVIEYFKFNPKEQQAQKFNAEVGPELIYNWEENMAQAQDVHQEPAHPAYNPYAFFYLNSINQDALINMAIQYKDLDILNRFL